jgi:hypothetical protein
MCGDVRFAQSHESNAGTMSEPAQNEAVVLTRTVAGQRAAVWGLPLLEETHLHVLLLVNGYTSLDSLMDRVGHADDVGDAIRKLLDLGLVARVNPAARRWPLWRSLGTSSKSESEAAGECEADTRLARDACWLGAVRISVFKAGGWILVAGRFLIVSAPARPPEAPSNPGAERESLFAGDARSCLPMSSGSKRPHGHAAPRAAVALVGIVFRLG